MLTMPQFESRMLESQQGLQHIHLVVQLAGTDADADDSGVDKNIGHGCENLVVQFLAIKTNASW